MEEDKLDKIMKFKQEMQRLGLSPVKAEEYTSPLNEAAMKFKGAASSADVTPISTIVKGAANADLTPAKNIVKGAVDKIDTKQVQKLISGSGFSDKIQSILKSRAAAKAANIGGDMIKKVPMIGGIAAGLGTLLTTGDASAASQAALPLVGDAEDIGPDLNSLEGKMEAGTATPDELYRLRNGIK